MDAGPHLVLVKGIYFPALTLDESVASFSGPWQLGCDLAQLECPVGCPLSFHCIRLCCFTIPPVSIMSAAFKYDIQMQVVEALGEIR